MDELYLFEWNALNNLYSQGFSWESNFSIMGIIIIMQ